MNAAQKALESSNAAAAESGKDVSNTQQGLSKVLSGKGAVADAMREQARDQTGKLFSDLAAGPESLLEAQVLVERQSSVDLEHKRISEELRSLYLETHGLEEERANLLSKHYALGREAS